MKVVGVLQYREKFSHVIIERSQTEVFESFLTREEWGIQYNQLKEGIRQRKLQDRVRKLRDELREAEAALAGK